MNEELEGQIAVIGMSGRFPGAATLDAFWANLRSGVESIRTLTEEELLGAGESQAMLDDPAYVRAAAPLENVDQFDAAFFGLSPRDAAVFDPQHRLFLECAWEAFEHAGYVGDKVEGQVGVFASCGLSEYMFKNVLANRQVTRSVGEWLIRHTGNDTNFLATRVSYEMNLRGPSMNVQTACSSTLVAIHLACQSLLSGECDMALAGGAVVSPNQLRGYLYKEGEILSPDGHCRPFDATAAGTVISSAAGAVLLKPMAAAMAEGDTVLAVIRGSAVNNDGHDKVGYLAPSVRGQARVVAEALAVAGVNARDVSYVEAHGTGTLIGDPIEVAGLVEAYRQFTDDVGFCAIGSLKSNIGHTGEASGVAAFIKTVLALQHRELPPSLHFSVANPQTGLATSPFVVNATLHPWVTRPGTALIAGVTSLGAGGTNAHVVLQEAPPAPSAPPATPSTSEQPYQLVTVSARSAQSLDRATQDLAGHLRRFPSLPLADVAYTRMEGRTAMRWRRAIVTTTSSEAVQVLESSDPQRVTTQARSIVAPSVVFMLPGGGAQYRDMGRDLYESEPVYRQAVDECCALVNPELGQSLQAVMFTTPGAEDPHASPVRLERPSVALPALFATEYAMAKLLASWDITPSAMIGHSVGEYVAACLSGVLDVTSAVALVALRGRLFERLAPGGMLSVSLGEADALALMPSALSMAAVNSPELCVVAGPIEVLAQFESMLNDRDIGCMRVPIDVAAHSSMLQPILAEFGAHCETIEFHAPQIPYVSNLTGTWVTKADVTDPNYWVRHLRETVRFGAGIQTLFVDPNRVMLEIGPGHTLSGLARAGLAGAGQAVTALARTITTTTIITTTMRHPKEQTSDVAYLLGAVGRVWAAGVEFQTARLWQGQPRRRVPLPTYPFERQRYWVEPDERDATADSVAGPLRKQSDVADWFSTPTWRRSIMPMGGNGGSTATWMVVHDGDELADELIATLSRRLNPVVEVRFGQGFQELGRYRYEVHPSRVEDWTAVFERLDHHHIVADRIAHVSACRGRRRHRRNHHEIEALDNFVQRDVASVMFLALSLSSRAHPVRLAVVTSDVHALGAEPDLVPYGALLHGISRVIPRELGHVASIAIDVESTSSAADRRSTLGQLLQELDADAPDELVVHRNNGRWVRTFDAVAFPPAVSSPWKPGGVYLITGGLGGIGLTIAAHIARAVRGVRIVLVGRSALPVEATWDEVLASPVTTPIVRRRIEAIREMRADGAEVLVACADVTDVRAMGEVVNAVRTQWGRITGVVHSAGILNDTLLALRTPSPHSPVIDTKARGVLVIDHLLAKQPPDLVMLFSSVSSFIGLPGQAEYSAANAFLDAFAATRNRTGRTRTLVINWSAWQSVGMAVDAVVAVRAAHDADQVASPVHLLEHAYPQENGDVVFTTAFSSRRHWLLAEHVVVGGEALIPGTGFLELIRSAVLADGPAQHPVELRDVFFLSPFQVGAGEVRTLSLKLGADGDVVVFSDSESSPHVVASAMRSDPVAVAPIDIAAIRARCGRRVERFEGYSAQAFMEFGPRWGNLRVVEYGDAEALITTVMPQAYHHELATLWLHPALVDMATGSAQALIPGFSAGETFYVPLSYGRVVARRPLPSHAVSHVRLRPGSGGDVAVFDVTIYNETGEEVAAIEEYTMRRVSAGAALVTPRSAAAPSTDVVRAESSIEAAMREGIAPHEGIDALDRVLAVDMGAQVVVSSMDIRQWTAQVDAEAIVAADVAGVGEAMGQQYQRPDISSTFVEPVTPIERDLAVMWQELLGVDRVGRRDNFFELGGHSLIAVRLFTRIRKTYAIDLALSTLFEAPTIEQCAAIVAEKAGMEDSPRPDSSEVDPGVEATKHVPAGFRSLVTIQAGDGRTPFFCVHGAGGNVLNFRDLSLAMGKHQPFYGLQARGIDGILRPLQSIEAMATAHLEEIRSVQPHGPYVLGGYSGGGLVAFEMAHQLSAVGEPVALVVLLDTFPPTVPEQRVTVKLRLDRLREDRMSYLKYMVTRRLHAARQRTVLAEIDELVGADDVVPNSLRELHLSTTFGAAAQGYTLKAWSGRVMLVRSSERLHFAYRGLDETYGWVDVVSNGFQVVEVEGNHETLVLGSNASAIASALRDVLASVETRPVPVTTIG